MRQYARQMYKVSRAFRSINLLFYHTSITYRQRLFGKTKSNTRHRYGKNRKMIYLIVASVARDCCIQQICNVVVWTNDEK